MQVSFKIPGFLVIFFQIPGFLRILGSVATLNGARSVLHHGSTLLREIVHKSKKKSKVKIIF